MSQNSRRCRSNSTMASCAGLGFLVAISSRRQLYHSHTKRGSRSNASGVARSSARNVRHKPSAPRKVGTPLSAEIPAPVKIVNDRAVAIFSFKIPRSEPVAIDVSVKERPLIPVLTHAIVRLRLAQLTLRQGQILNQWRPR